MMESHFPRLSLLCSLSRNKVQRNTRTIPDEERKLVKYKSSMRIKQVV